MTSINIRSTVFTALFAALFIVMSSIKIPLPIAVTAVPVTLQTLAVMLAGAFLGPRLGFLSIFTVVLLTALGLPLLHGEGGLAVIKGYTGGFILMFPISAFLVGLTVSAVLRSGLLARSQAAGSKSFLLRAAGFILLFLIFEVLCSFLAYVGGVPWLAHVLDKSYSEAMKLACYPFLPGDTIKAVIAAIILSALHGYVPSFNHSRRTGIQYTD
jgi:biotin transport system substrate-specific component